MKYVSMEGMLEVVLCVWWLRVFGRDIGVFHCVAVLAVVRRAREIVVSAVAFCVGHAVARDVCSPSVVES